MAGIIGKKIGMSSFFDQDGKSIPCTMIEAGPCIVTQIKNIEKDGYSAIQLGFEDKNQKKLKKSEIGHVKNASCQPLKTYSEFKNNYTRTNDEGTSEQFEPNVGDIVGVDMFNEGEFVDVTSTSKVKVFKVLLSDTDSLVSVMLLTDNITECVPQVQLVQLLIRRGSSKECEWLAEWGVKKSR